MGAERVHDGAHGHGCIDLLSQADAYWDVVFLFDFATAVKDFVPAIGRDSHVVPQVFAPVYRVRRKGRREADILFGLWVKGALDGQIDGLAVLLLALRDHVLHVYYLLILDRGRPRAYDEIVTV